MGEHIKRVVVYDWDGTICKSPENTDENKRLWEEKTGGTWSRDKKTGEYTRGWWGKPETLDPDVFDIDLVDEVVEQAVKDINDINTYCVLMTGRRGKCSKNIKEIWRRKGYPYFNEYLFNDEHSTQLFKGNKMKELFNVFDQIEFFQIWEDRKEHIDGNEKGKDIPSFKDVLHSMFSKDEFEIVLVNKDYSLTRNY